MDTYSTGTTETTYSGGAPLLLAGSNFGALERAEQAIAAAGFRVGAKLQIEEALERLDQQGDTSAVWVEIDADGGRSMDALLHRLSRDVADQRYAAVVSTRASALDAVIAGVSGDIELLVDPTPVDRIAALAAATARRGSSEVVAELVNDRSTESLRQLSEEVSRIATTLARLSAGPGAQLRPAEPKASGDLPPLSAETVRNVLRARRLRARFFAEDLFADPAWDMLLDLLQAEIAQLRVPVSSLCIAAAVPATTALRWLKTLVNQGIFIRRADPHDGRRVFVELAPEASQSLRRYFAEVGQPAVI